MQQLAKMLDRILWTIELDAPVTTTLTSSFDMRMRTVDAVSVILVMIQITII